MLSYRHPFYISRAERLLVKPSHQDIDIVAGWTCESAAGDRLAFQQLYQATSAKPFAIVLRLWGEPAGSRRNSARGPCLDLANSESYDVLRGRPMTWLINIARHRAIDRLRARPARATVGWDHITAISDPSPSDETLGCNFTIFA